MTVGKLINILKKLPEDAEVVEMKDWDSATFTPYKGTPGLARFVHDGFDDYRCVDVRSNPKNKPVIKMVAL